MRKLASLQLIDSIRPIPGAVRVECATVLGWEVVVAKNSFQPGDPCIFFEIDSLLPELPQFEFLRKSAWHPTFKRFRIRTCVLAGQVSQGLAIPLTEDVVEFIPESRQRLGEDVSDLFQIEKYVPIIPDEMIGTALPYSWPISKTEELRIQACPDLIEKLRGLPYYITSKLNGESMSVLRSYCDGGYETHVCGHTHAYAKNTELPHWQVAEKYELCKNIETLSKKIGFSLGVQGELIGPGIHKNHMGLKDYSFRVFNVWNTDTRRKLDFQLMFDIVSALDIAMVPVLETGNRFDYSFDEISKKSIGTYYEDGFVLANKDRLREGIVVRSKDMKISFKSISKQFLLTEDD